MKVLKFLVVILTLLVSRETHAQTWSNPNPGLWGIQYNRVKALLGLELPSDTTNNKRVGDIAILNDTLYIKNIYAWHKVSTTATGGVGGITHVVADYGLLNINDSTIKVDSATLANYFLRRKDSTTYYPYASNPKNYLTTAVTSVAKGWGILQDGTITTTGTVTVDSTLLDARYIHNEVPSGNNTYYPLDSTNTPPGSPVTDDAYLLGGSPTGAWAGHAFDIAIWNGSSWDFTDGVEGDIAITQDDHKYHRFNNTTWPVTSAVPLLNGGNFGAARGGTINNKDFSIVTNGIKRMLFKGSGDIQLVVDSSSSPVSMYGKGADGYIHRYAVPSGGGSGSLSHTYAPFVISGDTIVRRFNVLSYGGKNDGKNIYDVSTTNGSATITSASAAFTSADVGKVILVNGAGAAGAVLRTTIASFTNSTTVVLTATASATLSNDTTAYGTDNTAAIQAATNAAYANGGGTIYFPNGIYFLSTNSGGTGNCQIYIPNDLSSVLKNRNAILFEGESVTSFPSGYLAAFPGATPVTGVILRSTVSGSGTMPSVFASNSVSMNATDVAFKNMAIFVYSNNGNTAVSMTGVNGSWYSKVDADKLVIAPDVGIERTTSPVNSEVAAFIASRPLDGGTNLITGCTFTGFKYGLIANEHTLLTGNIIYGNYFGLTLPAVAGHTVSGSSQIFACAHEIYSPTVTTMGQLAGTSFVHLFIESEIDSAGITTWFKSVRNISDSGNNLIGDIRINNATNAGIFNHILGVYGGANLSVSSSSNKYVFENSPAHFTRVLNIDSVLTVAQGIRFTQTGAGFSNNLNWAGGSGTGSVDNNWGISVANYGSSGYVTSNGPYITMRGNSFSTVTNQQGDVYIAAGTPTTGGSTGGGIYLSTNDLPTLIIDKNQNMRLGAVAPTTADANAPLITGTSATTKKGLVIQGKASQTASLLELQASTGTSLTKLYQPGANTTLLQLNAQTAGTESGSFYYSGPDINNAAYGAFLASTSGGWAGVTGGVVFASSKNGSGTQLPMLFGGYNGSWTTWLTLSTAGAVRFNTYGAGTITSDASGNLTSVSDERLKTNINPYKAGLREILKINPITYKWNEESGNETEHTYAGFSAQNVKANIPFGTGENKDGYLSLQDRSIMAALVNAVKEMQAEIDQLKKELKNKK